MRPALVKIDYASIELNLRDQKIFGLIDGVITGDPLLWVFDLASARQAPHRDLRIWLDEIKLRAIGKATECQSRTIDWVIDQILPPHRDRYFGNQVGWLLQIHLGRRMDLDLDDELPMQQRRMGGVYYERAALAQFLRSRWLGPAENRARKSGYHAKAATTGRAENPLSSPSPELPTPPRHLNPPLTLAIAGTPKPCLEVSNYV